MNNGTESTSIVIGSRVNGRDLAVPNGNLLSTPLDGGGGPLAHHNGNDFRKLLNMMRGRWWLAAVLAAVGATLGGLAGFRAGHVIYASNGQVRIIAVIPRVLYEDNDGKGVPAMFDSFMESLVALMKSHHVMELAVQDHAWRAVGGSPSEPAIQELTGSTEITRTGELINLRATGLDPVVANASVKSIVDAFQQRYEEVDAESSEKRLLVLQNLQATKGNELAAIREQINNIARPFGTDNLEPLFDMKQTAVEKLKTTISETESELDLANHNHVGVHISSNLTPEQWASYSPEMAGLIKDRDANQRDIEIMHARGLLDSNTAVQTARAIVKVDEDKISELAARLKSQRDSGVLTLPEPGTPGYSRGAHAPVDPEALQENLTDLKKQRDDALQEMLRVGDQKIKIADLKEKAQQVIEVRNAAQQRIDQLNTEATINGRISVLSDGDRPMGPYKDTRITFAAAGIAGGLFIGFAIVLGLAAMDRRLRSPDETEGTSPSIGLLGLLPRLPENLADASEAARAAHCVTGVRNLLQLWSRTNRRTVFVVTSPVPGAGKTSLTLALGVSYATARIKTLVIDCDLVGAGLTGRADKIIVRKLGQLLLRDGIVTEGQLAEALAASRDRAARLGEIVVERGWASQPVIDRLLLSQRQDTIGILDALDGAPLDQCVTDTGIPNLAILPVGSATSRDVPLISAERLHNLVDTARHAYDVVLIDTGPVPGSLEAQLVASVADGVIVVVSPGIHRPLIRRCMDRLADVGGRVAGIVYNRASDHDVFQYTSGSQQRDMPSVRATTDGSATPVSPKFGPLATAVTQVAPSGKTSNAVENPTA